MIKEIKSKKELNELTKKMHKLFKYMSYASGFCLLVALLGAIDIIINYVILETFDIMSAIGVIIIAIMASFFLIFSVGFLIQQRYYDIIYRLDRSLK